MEYRYDSYCGLYCGACPVLVANENGTVKERAMEWGKKPQDLRCHGCKSGVNCVFGKDCYFKECAESKKLEFCSECEDYPCEKLLEFVSDKSAHHSIVAVNLGRIREVGVVGWIEEQRSRWSCPACDAKFTWYDSTCSNCGAELYNCRHEERDLHEEFGDGLR